MKAGAGTDVDFAYFAACDNWNEIKAIVGDEEVVLTSWNYNNGNGNENNVVARPVSEYLTYYITPATKIGRNLWNAGGYSHQGEQIGELMTEGGVTFNRIALWNGGSFELFHHGDNAVSSKGIGSADANLINGTGRYMVIRMRLGATEGNVGLLARNDGGSSESYINRSGLEGNAETGYYQQWRTYVIDLEQFTTYTESGSQTNATFAIKGDSTGGTSAENAEATDCIDIQYFAICQDWAEVQSVVGTDTEVVYSANWAQASQDVTYTAEQIAELVATEQAQ
jgi:hypothetical protein